MIARVFGRGPSILAPIITALAFNYVIALPEYAWAVSSEGLFETCIILTLGFAIAYLFQVQQHAAQSLRSANQALQEKTNALIQAQQGSNSAAWQFDTTLRKTSWYEGGSDLFGRSLAEIITLDLSVRQVPEIVCRPSEIRQVFGNLIQNAFEAMTKGGRMRLRVRPCTDGRNGARGVRITIANSGKGISAPTRKRIYEPFFTTKDGTNTGLGLWVTEGILDRHGGSIRVWSSTDPKRSGTAFSVVLPLRPPMVPGAGNSKLERS